MKIRVNKSSILLYLILIPFLHPRGFDEYYTWYKDFFTDWLYISIILICLYFIYSVVRKKEKYKTGIYIILMYYLLLILITVIIQKGFNTGLQKMFAAPALCIVCIMLLERNAKQFIDVVGNLLLIVLGLNVIVFNEFFWGNYFSAQDGVHLLFIGHVQIAAQLGMLGILIGYITRLFNGKWTLKCKLLILCSVLTMILSETAASIMSLGILFIGMMYIRYVPKGKLLKMPPKTYINAYVLGQLILLQYLYLNNWKLNLGSANLNGRGYIWKEAFQKIIERPFFGYGVRGVYLKVFWSEWIGDGNGMNYAHNQLLQQLLDGGLVLLVFFIVLLFVYTKQIKQIENKKILMFINLQLIILLFVMIFESTLEYYYVLFIFSIFAYMPDIERCANNIEMSK